jgi:dihydrodipicolinate synthase/N-acetylneuraminate lyase
MQNGTLSRRYFVSTLTAGATGLAVSAIKLKSEQNAAHKPLRGIFPIAQTPFTESDKLDVESLVEQLRFIDRGQVHGFVWPQLASEWSTLSESERLEGTEAITAEGKKHRPAVVIGVQAQDLSAAVRYAKHAEKAGADAIISLPPSKGTESQAILEYYKTVGAATALPLFVQAVGDMSVDLLLEMYKAIPTFRYLKDEAGQPLMRISKLRSGSADQLKIFTGGHGRTLLDEMMRGFSGSMPAAAFADLYAAAWDQWHEGKQKEALEAFGDASILINEIGAYGLESMKYILCLRGVFKTYRTRERHAEAAVSSGAALASGAGATSAHLDEEGKRVLRNLLDAMKPCFRAQSTIPQITAA